MESIRRTAIRGLILTPDAKVLLMKVEEPNSSFRVWLTPGGGILEGESIEECLRREIMEETGLRDFLMGPRIWTREQTFSWGDQNITQKELYYLIESDHFIPDDTNNPDDVEKVAMQQFHWWSIDEISKSEDNFVPRRLAQYLNDIVTSGPPSEPFDCGI